jgi:hypothetical protein
MFAELKGVIATPILLKEQAQSKKNSPYAKHVRLSKKFYTGMMATFGTKPMVVSKVVEQIVTDFMGGGQKAHYIAGPDAYELDKTLEREGLEWFVNEGSNPLIHDDQAHVDWFWQNFHLDVSATFKQAKRPQSKL